MMYFLDESLACLIQEYENQIEKYHTMCTLNNANKPINTLEDNKLQPFKRTMADQAA